MCKPAVHPPDGLNKSRRPPHVSPPPQASRLTPHATPRSARLTAHATSRQPASQPTPHHASPPHSPRHLRPAALQPLPPKSFLKLIAMHALQSILERTLVLGPCARRPGASRCFASRRLQVLGVQVEAGPGEVDLWGLALCLDPTLAAFETLMGPRPLKRVEQFAAAGKGSWQEWLLRWGWPTVSCRGRSTTWARARVSGGRHSSSWRLSFCGSWSVLRGRVHAGASATATANGAWQETTAGILTIPEVLPITGRLVGPTLAGPSPPRTSQPRSGPPGPACPRFQPIRCHLPASAGGLPADSANSY